MSGNDGYGESFVFTLMTNDPALAARADAAGVDRIGVDIERRGKLERQGPGYRISDHLLEELAGLRPAVRRGRLFARLDPLHEGTREQVEVSLSHGVDVLMLPMFHSPDEASRFVEVVGGRAEVSLLIETAAAAERAGEVAALDGVTEVFVGLNDLQLSQGSRSRFEPLLSGQLARISGAVLASGRRFGFGGLARVDDTNLPVPAALLYPHYPRLGATSAILARSFLTEVTALGAAVDVARDELEKWYRAAPADRERACEALGLRMGSAP